MRIDGMFEIRLGEVIIFVPGYNYRESMGYMLKMHPELAEIVERHFRDWERK